MSSNKQHTFVSQTPEPQLLFRVIHRAWLKGQILVDPDRGFLSGPPYASGDPIVLRRPDGSEMDATITHVCTQMFGIAKPTHEYPILLEHLSKKDVPVGTEVWSRPTTACTQPSHIAR